MCKYDEKMFFCWTYDIALAAAVVYYISLLIRLAYSLYICDCVVSFALLTQYSKIYKKKSNIIAFCVSQAAITHSCNTQQNKKAHETKKNIFICIHIIHFLSRRVLPFIHNNREYREYDWNEYKKITQNYKNMVPGRSRQRI